MSSQQTLGRYEIVETLGRGAAGVVYLAQDPALGRLVALKTLDRAAGGEAETLSHLREARAAGSLDHPNIVTVYDVAAAGERPFIAMEFVQGTDLKELLRPRQPLPHDFVLQLVEQVASALDHAHGRGIVHRDVKPGNILITDDERVKLADFGIADTHGDRAGDRLGTPHYVAPEQLKGQPVDRRADVFSLGVVVYEMLTGRRPFEAPQLEEVVRRLADEPFTPPAEHGVQLPVAVEDVLARALAKDPTDRFATAGKLSAALAEALQTPDEAATRDLSDLLPEPAAAPAAAAPPPAPRRHRRLLPWAAAAALALLAAAASGWALVQRSQETSAAVRTAPPHRLHAPHAELAAKARQLAAAGDLLAAARTARLASDLAPHRGDLAELSRLLETEADGYRDERARQGEVELLLQSAQEARQAGRFREALAALTRAAELDPELPAVRELQRRVRNAHARQQALAERQSRAEPAVVDEPVVRRAATKPEPEPEPDWADLRVDLFSHLPRGVLTLYADGEQVLQQTFRFGKRTGVFRRQSGAGRLEARRRLRAGDAELRVYLSLPGRPAVSEALQATLAGGSTSVLRILVAEGGELQVRLD